MPIIFSQPQPMLPDASIGAGRAQEYNATAPMLARQQEAIAQMIGYGYRAGGGGAQLPQRPPQGALYGPSGGGGGQQPSFAQPPQPRDDPLVQAEVIRLQQLKNGMAYVDQQEQSGSLTSPEAADLRTQLQTGINPLQQRQQRAQASALEQQTQMMMHQNAQMLQMQNMDAQQRARLSQSMVYSSLDDDGNGYRIHTDPVTGRQTYHEVRAQREGPQERGGLTPQLHNTIQHQVEQNMVARLRQAQTAGTPIPDDLKPENWQNTLTQGVNARVARIPGASAGGGRQGQTGWAPGKPEEPLDTGDMESWQPHQRLAYEQLDDWGSRILNPQSGLSEARGRELMGQINRMRTMLREWHNVSSMPQGLASEYASLARSVGGALAPAPSRPGQAAPTRAESDRNLAAFDSLVEQTPQNIRSMARDVHAHARDMLRRYGSARNMPAAERATFEGIMDGMLRGAAGGEETQRLRRFRTTGEWRE